MPELPEVEFCARRLREWAVGHRIVDLRAHPGSPLRGGLTPAALGAHLMGRQVRSVDRQGKQLVVHLDADLALLLHLGMTGKVVRVHPDTPDTPDLPGERVRLALDDGTRLVFVDPRRFGRVRVLASADLATDPALARLGPDALELCDRPGALGVVAVGRRAIKTVLMDQRRLAGVGNIHACEALFGARVDPWAAAGELDEKTLDALAAAIAASFRATLDQERGESITYINEARTGATQRFVVYGRAGEPCPRCADPIERTPQSGRGTWWCRTCQIIGRPVR